MVKFLSLAFFLIISVMMYSQVPQGIPYQAVIRDTQGNPILNQSVSVKFSLHDQTADGTIVFEETHSTSTNEVGLFSLTFGSGVTTIGTFNSINWSSGYKFLQVQTDIGNGFVDNGTQQLMSVPYALFSGTATQIQPAQELQLGQEYQGGTIFYLDKTGQHGFVMADTTIFCPNCRTESSGYPGNVSVGLNTSSGLYSGRTNTAWCRIITESIPIEPTSNIFYIVEELSFAGYDDWFIPSWTELMTAYINLNESTTLFSEALNYNINSSTYETERMAEGSSYPPYGSKNRFLQNTIYPNFLRLIDLTDTQNFHPAVGFRTKIVREF